MFSVVWPSTLGNEDLQSTTKFLSTQRPGTTQIQSSSISLNRSTEPSTSRMTSKPPPEVATLAKETFPEISENTAISTTTADLNTAHTETLQKSTKILLESTKIFHPTAPSTSKHSVTETNGSMVNETRENVTEAEITSPKVNSAKEASSFTESDSRPSAIGIGVIALILLIIFVILIMLLDYNTIRKHVKRRMVVHITTWFNELKLRKTSVSTRDLTMVETEVK